MFAKSFVKILCHLAFQISCKPGSLAHAVSSYENVAFRIIARPRKNVATPISTFSFPLSVLFIMKAATGAENETLITKQRVRIQSTLRLISMYVNTAVKLPTPLHSLNSPIRTPISNEYYF